MARWPEHHGIAWCFAARGMRGEILRAEVRLGLDDAPHAPDTGIVMHQMMPMSWRATISVLRA